MEIISPQKLFLWLVTLFFLGGCGPQTLIEKRTEIPNAEWTYANRPRFEFEVPDTMKLYNMKLRLTHTDAYAWENLYVKLHTFFPNGQQTEFMKSLSLTEVSGKWLGTGWGSSKTLEIPLIDSFYFTKPGPYALEVEQFMREDSLAGIESVGLVVEDCGKNRRI